MRQQDDVRAFHRKFGHAAPDRPSAPDSALVAQRMRLLFEEYNELQHALTEGDLAAILGEAVDLIYVTLGTLVSLGLDVDRAFDAIHRANMSKYPNPKPGGKPLKPEGWEKPDLARLVKEQM